MADRYLLESSSVDGYLLEDGSGVLLLNNGVVWDFNNTHSELTISSDGLTLSRPLTDSSDRISRANTSKSSGKWYFEVTIGAIGGNIQLGFDDGTLALSGTFLGGTNTSIAWKQTGDVLTGGGALGTTIGTYTVGDVLGFAWDAGAGKAYFRKNGTWQNSADPVAGTGGFSPTSAITNGYPTADPTKVGDSLTANFGASSFNASVPSGFTSWDGSQVGSGGPPAVQGNMMAVF